MIRCYAVGVLVFGFSVLTACGGAASNGAFGPRVPATGVRPLSIMLYSFGGNPDGEWPQAGLLAGKKGEYYGTTVFGGSAGDGAVYAITAAGKEKVVYSFQGLPDGSVPESTLIMDNEGSLYGTTERGGTGGLNCGEAGCGTVFKLTPGKHGWTERVLYAFQSSPDDGAYPMAGLLMTK
ncbi:MAG TPA: choice-of-anchor tandem repeat GloVer-containing protein, partial [Candidatus Cybelea sp.]